MALLVCCPCGNPVDCDHLEVVVTLACPRCQRELTLEVENAEQRYFAVLTVMEGPYWVGEQFVMPVGEELRLGKAAANWLSLESDALAETHCRLFLSPNGRVDVEDLSADSDTWIGNSCVTRGRLKSQESLTIGEYRLRLDFKDAVGGGFVSQEADTVQADARPLPTLSAVAGKSPLDWVARNRFLILRWLLLAFASFVAVYHVCILRGRDGWPWYWALAAGSGVFVVMLVSAQWMKLANRYRRYGSLGALVLLAVVDIAAWRMPLSAIAAMLLASMQALIFTRLKSPLLIVYSALLGVAGVVMTAIIAIRSILDLFVQ
ncbi:MAG: hypothetical protein MI923_19625 [Phycisphaerales bacterium]|nr:hypothetical protein [Phycisphaerales bacterium]